MTTPTLIKPLTVDDALELLRKVVADFGHEYVYVNASGQRAGECLNGGKSAVDCAYVHEPALGADLRPGCLVGQVLHRHGVPLSTLMRFEGSAFGTFGVDAGFSDDDAQEVLHAAQMKQDQGKTWGEALAAAEECAENIAEVKAALAAGELGS